MLIYAHATCMLDSQEQLWSLPRGLSPNISSYIWSPQHPTGAKLWLVLHTGKRRSSLEERCRLLGSSKTIPSKGVHAHKLLQPQKERSERVSSFSQLWQEMQASPTLVVAVTKLISGCSTHKFRNASGRTIHWLVKETKDNRTPKILRNVYVITGSEILPDRRTSFCSFLGRVIG